MADKNFLSWVGFKGEDESKPAPTQNALERIRELESQLNDLRSRRDITGLSREEFEILATETAMAMIKSAQAREAKANTAVQRLVTETNRNSKEKLEAAEAKAKSNPKIHLGLFATEKKVGCIISSCDMEPAQLQPAEIPSGLSSRWLPSNELVLQRCLSHRRQKLMGR